MTVTFIKKVLNNLRGIIHLKSEDILLTSFPKSGNTWIRFFLCNLGYLSEHIDKHVDFSVLDATMPELGYSDLSGVWRFSHLPRFVKTHKRYMPLFGKNKTILVLRDPKDTMVSYFNYLNKNKNVTSPKNFSEFIRHPKFGLKAWFEFQKSWEKHSNLVLVLYEEMKTNTLNTFKQLVYSLEIDIAEDMIQKAVFLSRTDNIRKSEREDGLSEKARDFEKDFKFVRSGEMKQWSDYFSESDLLYFDALKTRYKLKLL